MMSTTTYSSYFLWWWIDASTFDFCWKFENAYSSVNSSAHSTRTGEISVPWAKCVYRLIHSLMSTADAFNPLCTFRFENNSATFSNTCLNSVRRITKRSYICRLTFVNNFFLAYFINYRSNLILFGNQSRLSFDDLNFLTQLRYFSCTIDK